MIPYRMSEVGTPAVAVSRLQHFVFLDFSLEWWRLAKCRHSGVEIG